MDSSPGSGTSGDVLASSTVATNSSHSEVSGAQSAANPIPNVADIVAADSKLAAASAVSSIADASAAHARKRSSLNPMSPAFIPKMATPSVGSSPPRGSDDNEAVAAGSAEPNAAQPEASPSFEGKIKTLLAQVEFYFSDANLWYDTIVLTHASTMN